MSFDVLIKAITSGFTQFRIADAVDIIIITFLLYHLIRFSKETRAYQLLKGFAVLLTVAILSDIFQLSTLTWALSSLLVSGIIVIVVLFQPELRRALEHIGRGRFFELSIIGLNVQEAKRIVNEIHTATLNLAKRRIGSLIVIEQKTALGEIIATGTRIEGFISAPLIENIFEPNTPLHDGAIIIRGGIIASAASFLPLVEDLALPRDLGTRHRAALSISTVSDSVTIVVSEETGIISFARDGKLIRYVDDKGLFNLLESLYLKEKETPFVRLKRRVKNETK